MSIKVPMIQPEEDCCRDVREPRPLGDPEHAHLVALLKALADPTRLDIFRLIAAQAEPICACDVVARFDVSQPTISHHLKVLREAGLITSTKRGVWAWYAVDDAGLNRLQGLSGMLAPGRDLADVLV